MNAYYVSLRLSAVREQVPESLSPTIRNSRESRDFAVYLAEREGMELALKEYFYAIFLNRRNRVSGWHLLSMGGTAGTVVDPKLLFGAALLKNAHSIIMVHNHPSGDPSPSPQDNTLTANCKLVGQALECKVLDHIVLGDDYGKHGGRYYSFADEGLL